MTDQTTWDGWQEVVGESNYQDALQAINTTLSKSSAREFVAGLHAEPTNPDDSNAVVVVGPSGERIGYLPRAVAARCHKEIASAGVGCKAVLIGGTNERPSIGVMLSWQPTGPTMAKCPFCAEEIQWEAHVCKHCGRDLAPASAQPETSSGTPTQPSADKKKTGCLAWGCGTVIVVFGLLVLIGALVGPSGPTPASDRPESTPNNNSVPEDQSTMAIVQCQNYVRSSLRSPSTADFPFFDREVSALGDQTYLVRSYVDAQNAFGVEVRTDYAFQIRYTGGGSADRRNWVLVDLQTSP